MGYLYCGRKIWRQAIKLANPIKYSRELIEIAEASPWFMSALSSARELGLHSWCIGAGAVRALVWDFLHGYTKPSALADVDLVYFDSSNLAKTRDDELQTTLQTQHGSLNWEVTNQARIHLWYEQYFGYPMQPFNSLDEAVGSWPEYATCVGIWLKADGSLGLIAPHGLEDLFNLTIRHNPGRVNHATFLQRVAQKQYNKRWPKVKILASPS